MVRKTKINFLEGACVATLLFCGFLALNDLGKGNDYFVEQPYVPIAGIAAATGVTSKLYRNSRAE